MEGGGRRARGEGRLVRPRLIGTEGWAGAGVRVVACTYFRDRALYPNVKLAAVAMTSSTAQRARSGGPLWVTKPPCSKATRGWGRDLQQELLSLIYASTEPSVLLTARQERERVVLAVLCDLR